MSYEVQSCTLFIVQARINTFLLKGEHYEKTISSHAVLGMLLSLYACGKENRDSTSDTSGNTDFVTETQAKETEAEETEVKETEAKETVKLLTQSITVEDYIDFLSEALTNFDSNSVKHLDTDSEKYPKGEYKIASISVAGGVAGFGYSIAATYTVSEPHYIRQLYVTSTNMTSADYSEEILVVNHVLFAKMTEKIESAYSVTDLINMKDKLTYNNTGAELKFKEKGISYSLDITISNNGWSNLFATMEIDPDYTITIDKTAQSD